MMIFNKNLSMYSYINKIIRSYTEKINKSIDNNIKNIYMYK